MRVAIVLIPPGSDEESRLEPLVRFAAESGLEMQVVDDAVAASARLAELTGDARSSTPHPGSQPHMNGGATSSARLLRAAELLEREQAARTEADCTRRRSSFLASAGEILSTSFGSTEGLQQLTERAVPDIADFCAIDMLDEEGAVIRVALATGDIPTDRAADGTTGSIDLPSSPLVAEVLRNSRSAFYPFVPDDLLTAFARGDAELEQLRSIGLTSAIVVPIAAPERTIGTITFCCAGADRHFSVDDLTMAEELARRLAGISENARLYAQLRQQTELLQVTLASIGDAVISTDRDGRVRFMNEVAEAWTGWALTDALGMSIEDVLELRHEGSTEALPSPVTRVSQFGAVVGHEGDTVLVTRDGSSIPVEESAAPIRDSEGELRGVVMVFRDVAERRRVDAERANNERELALERDRIASVVRSVPGIVWEWWQDPDEGEGRVDYVSDFALEMLGLAEGDRTLSETLAGAVVHPEDVERVLAEYRSILEHEDGGTVGCRMISHDGRTIWTEARCVVIRDADGRRLGLRGVTMDVSHRRRAEEEMIRARDEAEAANRSKDQFLAVLSHELRTPLTPVLAVTSVLEADERIAPDQRPLIEMIRRNIELEARLIDDLLDLTRIAKGKLALNTETIDVHELANSVVSICRTDVLGKRLNLILDLKARDHFVRADPARMQQILWNLIKNGVKFTPEGGRITLRTFNDRPGRIAIEVSDTGLGIEPHILPRIFAAFDQGDLEVTRQFGGLGLGLAISHSLVEMHAGTLTVRSDGRNMGSTFTVTMETVVRLREPGTHGGEGAIRVLIVDDHVETGKVMKLLLERRGYRVESAHSVKEAVAVAGEHDFDLLISDIGLPDGSGLELMRALAGKRIRGIALSGFGMEEDIARSREAGFAEHLIKPVSFRTLQETIARVLA